MEQWYIENPKLLEEVKTSLQKNLPTLHVVVENQVVFIRGSLFLFDDKQTEIDRYSVEIELLPDYPDSVPLIRETGGRIPRIADRHIFTDGSGNCCLFVREETWKYYPKGTTLVDFIKQVVTYYFLNQTHYELTGKWIWGERSHGAKGVLEFYQEELNTTDEKIIHSFIFYLTKATLKKHWICYCGSKKKLQHCHYGQLKTYRQRIDRSVAINSLGWLIAEAQKNQQARRTPPPTFYQNNRAVGVRDHR